MVEIGPLEDFPVDGVRVVVVERRQIGVVRTANRIFALRNVCPHQSGPLCAGLVMPRLTASGVGTGIEADQERPIITCPWHGWEFDLESGGCLTDGSMQVAAYPVEVVDGRIHVDLGSRRRREGAAITRGGPA